MTELRSVTKLYIAALGLAVISLALLNLSHARSLSYERGVLAVVCAGLVAVTVLFPVHFAFKTKMVLDISVIFAAVLLFPPGVAMLIAGVGSLVGDVISRRPWDEALFNGSQASLQACVGGLLMALVGWNFNDAAFTHPNQLAMIAVAAAAMHLVSTFSVATIIGLESEHSPLVIWRQTIAFDGVEQFSHLALGLLAAAIIDSHPWALPLLLLPAVAVYRSSERHVQLRSQTLGAVESLADVVDVRDPYTANHSRRVSELARKLAATLGLTPDEVDLVALAARVHDVGKIVVDTTVLTKEGRLTGDEWEQLKQHPVTGAEILSRFPQFSLLTSYVLHHHERFDGAGYPARLSGEQIPLGARIIAVADSFDAMTTARPYRRALPMDVVLAEFAGQREKQWDPRVVDVLLELLFQERIAPQPESEESVVSLRVAV